MTLEWQVVRTDNFGRESVADKLVTASLSEDEAEELAEKLNAEQPPWTEDYYIATNESYRLSRGMEDLV